jgi:thiol-disulfide isomerase/thioredoxin
MSGSIRFAIGVCLAMGLSGAACTKESSEAKSSDAAETAEVAVATEERDAAGSGTEPGTGSSADAYRALIQEVDAVQSSGTSQEEAVAKIEGLLKGFIAEYPGTEEAADAQINLGVLYMQLGRNDESIAILYEVIDGGAASREKVGIAHYVLGDAYRASDQFDKAKREYTTVIEKFAFLNERITMAARTSLEELDALKLLAIGSKPIAFEVKGTAGEALSLDKYKGKVVLLDFWATWCGPCRADMPSVVNLYKKHHKNGFEIIGISLDRSREALDRYVKANEMTWPQFFDGKYWENEIAMKYKIRSIPATFLIDRQGVLRYRSVRGRQLEEAVDKLVKEPS